MKHVALRTSIPGPKSCAAKLREEPHLAPGTQRFSQLAGIVLESGSGSTVTDLDDNVLLDIIGGIGVNGLGYAHPRWIAAVEAQIRQIAVGSFTTLARIELLERLAAHRPSPQVHQLQLYSGGAEAVESALRLVKSATKKYEVVSFWGGFHGKTLGVLGLMGSTYKQELGPFAPGAHIVPYADCYRCPFRLKYPSCGLACLEYTRKHLKINSEGKIAAFLVEPMQGTNGNVIPPPEFLRGVASIAQDFGALLIVDEMITGFGRTGTYWGAEHSGVQGDIVTLGKQFGGGVPVSGVLVHDAIARTEPWALPSGSSSSYGGNPLAAAAAAATLQIIDEESLVENSRKVGAYFLEKLQALSERFRFIGQARGVGLMLALELVEDPVTRVPLAKEHTHFLFHECLKRGLLTMGYDARFRIQPAMTIDESTVDEAVDILTESFNALECRLKL